jgi:hypothetical protein
MTPARWDWDAVAGPRRVVAELGETGVAWLRAPELVEAVDRDPWAAAERLLGERPLLVERQPIRATPGGRSFSSGCMAAPFHSDSQTFLGVPPHAQVMACRAAAEAGGESLYLDTWTLLDRAEREAPPLAGQLFEVCRRFRFVFGDLVGPTVSVRGDSLVFTHSPRPLPDDPVAAGVASLIEAIPHLELRAEAGDLMVIHNHRLLHGRRAFADERRAFTRLLVWRRAPWPAPPRWIERAAAAARRHAVLLREAPVEVRTAFGLGEPPSDVVRRRLGIVLEVLRGVPAGLLSVREAVPEPELYRWRDAVLGGAADALSRAGDASAIQAAVEAWLQRLQSAS